MAKGKILSFGGNFWPEKDKTPIGEEVVGTYQGLVDGEYHGKPKQSALFRGTEANYQIGGGQMVKVIAPKLEIGKVYFVTFTGMMKTSNGEAFQFEVAPDE